MLTVQQALDYIHQKAWQQSRLGLSRTAELLERMGNPQRKLRYVHIAGTNGKGSTAAMLSSVLQRAGYVTGLYTSPYLERFNERIRVDGVPIDDDALAALTGEVRAHSEQMQDKPTEFELVTCIGFAYFARRNCDIVVLEVGMGGRLDSTNVIERPEAAVIAAIGLDHTEILGGTVEQIAAEKAGIVKAGCPVVLAAQSKKVERVVRKVCRERQAAFYRSHPERMRLRHAQPDAQTFDAGRFSNLKTALVGRHQLENAALVLETVRVLRRGGWSIPTKAVREGLEQARWPGRFELLRRAPLFIVDGGHNPQGAQTVADTLALLFPSQKPVLLIGVLADKDWEGIIGAVAPLAGPIFTLTPLSPRALPAAELAARIERRFGLPARPCADIGEGIKRAMATAGPDGVVCSFGSIYLAGAVRAAVLRTKEEEA